MPDKFDPYREALVIETETIWPEDYDDWEPAERDRIARRLHEEPDQATQLAYVREHTGFRRSITVTDEDLQRLQ